MRTPATSFGILLLLLGLLSGIARELSLTNLAQLLREAETCYIYPTNATKELAWMVGKWECTDRVIREYWNGMYRYAWLHTIYLLSESSIEPAKVFGSNITSVVVNANYHPIRKRESGRLFDSVCFIGFEGSDCYYNLSPGGGDPFWLKRERGSNPNWFILEHQDEGHIFLFRRVPEEDEDEPVKDEAKQKSERSAPSDSPGGIPRANDTQP